MREFFAFMGGLKKVLLGNKTVNKVDFVLHKFFVKIDLRNRSRKFIAITFFALAIFIGFIIFFATAAKAEKEVHAYVTASYISGEGVENISAAQSQDLSVDARFSDFTPEVSARVAFGAFTQTVDESIKSEKNIDTTSTSTEATSSTPILEPIIETKVETTPIENNSTGTTEKPVTFLKSFFETSKKFTANLIGLKTVIAQESPSPVQSETSAPTKEPVSTDAQKEIVQEVKSETIISNDKATTETTSSSTDSALIPEIKKEDRDPFKVSSCSTFGKPCHLISLEGFGVGPELSKYPVKDARLMLSLAGRALPSDHPDRIVIRAYTDGRWNYLGEQVVKGEFDNAMRGSYVSMPLSIDSWSDLADMIVSVEYVREGDTDSVAMIDSAWVDVAFAAEESPDDLALYSSNVKSALLARDAERRARERDHLELQNGLAVDFKNTMQGLIGSKLRVATTKEKISVFGTGEEYVAVTNFNNTAEKVHLSFYFPEEGGRVTEIAKYVHNSPYKVVESKNSPIAYFCEQGWVQSTSTDEVIENKPYLCNGSSEPHICSSISASGTSCLSEITSINKEESTVYRRFFEPDSIFAGSYSEKQSLVGRVIDSIFADMPDNTIPASQKEVSYSNSFDLEPGATKYFRVGFSTPLNSRGDIYIKAESDGGSYGLAKTEFDGSWNWRMPVDVGLPYRVNSGEVAMPISLDKMPLSFWDHVNDIGSDIRFSDEDGTTELPSWVAEFNKQTRKGFVWVRLPENAGVMPRIFLYAGNGEASPLYKPWQAFMTSTLSDRSIIVSNGVEDVDVQVTALAPVVRVAIGDSEEKTLLYGETALFNSVKNSSIIKATGPVSSRVTSVFGRATAAPLGLSAMNVGIPDGTLELGVVSGQGEKGYVTVGKTENELSENSVFRTPTVDVYEASSSIPSLFVADTDTNSYILNDTSTDERYKLSSSVVLDKKALGVRAVCDSARAFGAYDNKGSLLATTTCNSVLNGPFEEGTLVSVFYGATTTPFSAVFSAQYNGDERVISGSDINSRNPAGYDPEVVFGEPEFVIPGEHRLFDSEFNKDKPHITRFLSKKREFSAEENPLFKFQYKPQSSSFFRTLRSFVGLSPFKVEDIVVEQAGHPVNIKTVVEYTGNLEWTVKLDKVDVEKIAPGKLTLKMNIKEGMSTYEDSYDFYWGLLSVNFNKTVYEKGETSYISLGALSETGNTVCDAKLKLFVSNGTSTADEIPVTTSGKCDGNNVVDEPDYTASFTPVDIGTYNLRLIRLDDKENVLAEVRDSFKVVNHQSYIIERKGPTRINPTSPYEMTLRVVSREGYSGKIIERIPGDFEVIDRGGSELEWSDDSHTIKFAVWNVNLKPGEVYQYTYRFDAPDISPYIYFLGPATIGEGDSAFTEARRWMIASDAVGRMIIYWSNNTTPPPAASWDCISCGGGTDNTLVNRWPMGSSTYARTGGASTHTTTGVASVGPASGQASNIGNGGTAIVYKDHTHSIGAPTISVGNHVPLSLSLKAYKNKNAGEQNVPAGALLFFEEIPTGWTEYTAMNGRYPYGAASAGTTNGVATHTHTVTSSTNVPIGGGTYISGSRSPGLSDKNHVHSVPSVSTVAVANNPPYVTYRMASANANGPIPNGAIAMWDQDPAIGWLNLSAEGGVLENKFVRVESSAGSTGGSETHTHADILGVRTNTSATVSRYPLGASNPYGSASSHTHLVDYTSFSTATNLPPYATVIFGKRSVGAIQYTQENYHFYDNVNDIQPIDPWPMGSDIDLGENQSIDDPGFRIKPGSSFRLRMNVFVGNATSTAGANKLKLQYSTDGVCSSALNWTDVGTPDSSSPLRGYDNSLVSHGASLGTALLTSSTPASLQYYSELSNSLDMVRDGRLGTYAEFDWSLNASSDLASSSRYCLRMVEDSGKVLNSYSRYPSFISNNAPNAPTLENYFDNAKVNTLTPVLSFTTTDNENNAMHYMIEIDDDPNFGSPNVSQSTSNASGNFSNQTNPSNKVPYTGGDMIQYHVQSGALQNNTTYWWRVRAMDPVGSTQYGDWSTTRSFTTDTSLSSSAWFQTTGGQFGKNVLEGVVVSGDSVVLGGTSSVGYIYSQPMTFSDGTMGTVWGKFQFNDDGGGNISYQIEYRDKFGGWNLVPDDVLSGNSSGFTSSPVSLSSIDPLFYPTIRIKANFNESLYSTPTLYDWSVVWAYKTLAPTLSAPFNSAKVNSLTPAFDFVSTDPLGKNITYEIQYSDNPEFSSPTTCNSDSACSSSFTNLVTPSNVSPFKSGDLVEFQMPNTLTDGATYYWRVRAMGKDSGAWSFWSEVRSFTIDVSVVFPTWFQTMKGQFSLDTLSGVYANNNNSITVATTSDKVLIVYGSGPSNIPKYRFYQFGSLSDEKDMLSIGSTVLWATAKASAAYDQFIVGTMGSNRSVKYQVLENGIWSRLITFPQSGPSAQRKSFDVSYESKSGHAIAMSCNGKNADYAIFDGTSWGSVQTLNLGFSTNCEVIKMASNPIKNEIMAVFRDTGPTYRVEVWNGSTWTTSRFNFNTANAGMFEPQHDGVAVEYERNSGRALVVVSRKGNRGFVYRMWNGSSWGTETSSSYLGNNTTAQFEWGNLKKDPNSNDLMLCAISQYSITDDGAFTDLVRWNSGSSVFNTNKSGEYYPYSRHAQSFDCEYESKTGREGNVLAVSDESWASADGSTSNNRTIWDVLDISSNSWQSGQTDTERRWNYDGSTYNWNTSEIWTNKTDRAVYSGDIINVGLARNTLDYIFSVWDGNSWLTPQSLAPASVTTKPLGQPFDVVSQEGFNQGVVFSHPIDFGDGKSPAWREVRFNATKPTNTNVLVSVEYFNGTDWSRIPDSQIPGNSTGIATSPISLQNVNSITYNTIRLRADLVCSGFLSCPTLDDWTLEWAQGLTISGIARNSNRSTAVTSGIVKVAVNGIEQAGRTGTINASGNWTIAGVKYKVGDTVTLWIDNPGVANRAVAVVKYAGGTSLSNVELSRKWLTIGDSGQAGMTISNEEIKLFDNNNESGVTRPDIFFNGDANDNLNLCNTGNCGDFSLAVATGTTWRPKSDAASITTLGSLVINGTLAADANTIKVSGDWLNSSTFSAGNSTVIFNATSSTKVINNAGASMYKFNHVTFGEVATPAVWQLQSPLYTNGDIKINYGTLSPLSQPISIEKNLAIGTNGLFVKGSATTTFLGSSAANWSDQSTRGQDLGNVLVAGSPKVLSLGSKGMATNVTIDSNDSIQFGVNNLIITGSLVNNGSFTSDSGTLTASSTGSVKIKTGGYLLNNLTVINGAVSWVESVATTTGDVLIQGGTTTFPNQLYVGGGFVQTGGTFVTAATTTLTATSPGKQISLISNVADLVFAGSGGWAFGANATTTGSIYLKDGNVTLPSGTLSVAKNFINSGSIINNNNGTLRFRGNPSVATLNGQFLGDIITTSGCNFSFSDLNATTTGSITAEAGSVFNLPTNGSITVGGSLINNGTMNQSNTALFMNRASGAATFSPAALILSNVTMTGGANYSVVGNVRVSQNFSLGNVGGFTMQSARALRVDGAFTNSAQNANTTWTGSTLQLTSGSTQSINTKSLGGDDYATVQLDNGTQMRMWNSTLTAVTTNAGSGVYAQNWAGVNGALRIYGTYNQNSGTAYWSYGTDFDGTVLAEGRQVAVTVNSAATVNINPSASIEVIGVPNASTTIGSISGTFNMNMATSTLRSSYASIRGMTANGINMSGTTTIAQLDNTEFLVDTNNGYAMTMSKDVVDANASKQFANDYFRKGLAGAAYSIRVPVASTNYIRFKMHSGNIAGESFDNDISGNPGEIRWDDSNYVITVSGTVYSDLGVTKIGSSVCDGTTQVLRIQVSGGASYSTSCNPATSAFTFGAVTFTGEPAMSIYLKGTSAKGVTITRGVTTNLTGMDVYKDRIIVRHEDVLAMNTAKLATFDADNDADMLFTANTGTLNIPSSYGLYVWPNKTFTPLGNVTLGSGGPATVGGRFHLGANSTYNAADTDVITVGGEFRLESGALFNQASSTVILNPSDMRNVYAPSPITFGNLILSGAGTSSLQRSIIVNGNLNINSGVLYSNTAGVTTYGNMTGNGLVNIVAATLRMMKDSNFGGDSNWYLNNLILGDGSTAATTTKVGVGTTTISGVMTIGANHEFDISSKNFVFNGTGDVVVKNGNIVMPNSVVTYAPKTTLNVANLPYSKLLFADNGTSTLPSSKINISDDLVIGAYGTPTVRADSQNTPINIDGNVSINTGSFFYAANTSPLNIKGSWVNNGTFTNNGGIINFIGSGSKTINPGISSFGTINFSDNFGSWTILENATATNLTIGSTTSWILSPTKTLEIKGNFLNLVGGTKTTWVGSTLYLNTAMRDEVNPKDTGSDIYDIVKVSAGTEAVFWNSSSTQFVTASGGGVISQNHAGVNGDLYIFGDYTRNTGTEHWSYLLDFDGEILTADKLRAPKIRFANGATASYIGTSNLQIIGKPFASTTIRALSGNFGLSIGGATTTMHYADFSGMNSSGVQLTNTVKVTQMDDVAFSNPVGNGTMLTVMSSVINANPLRTTYNNSFVSSGGNNVTVIGKPRTAWRIRNHYGNLAGEAFDNDPGGDPGYMIWDDSAAMIFISGSVYDSDGTTVSNICDGVTQNVQLKVQGSGTLTSACDPSDGSYSIGPVVYGPYDTLTVYATNGGVAYAFRPMTSVSDMDLYKNTVIVRNEQADSITNENINSFDNDDDPIIGARVTGGVLTLNSGTKLIVWDAKSFAPGGNVIIGSNTNSSPIDGDLELRPGAEWVSNGNETYTIGGDFIIGSGGRIGGTGGEFIFTSNVAGKTIAASTPMTLSSLTFNGSGSWAISGVATTTGSVKIFNGNVSLPNTSFAIGGDFNNQSTFNANGGTIVFNSKVAGNQIRSGNNNFNNIIFDGALGGWAFMDNATTTGNFTIATGTPILPGGTLSVGGDFENIGGAFNSNNGTLIVRGSGDKKVVPGGSIFGNLLIENGDYKTGVQNATTTGDVIISSGSLELPEAQFAVGGSFKNSGIFTAGSTSTVRMISNQFGKIVNPGSSSFNNLVIDGTGGFTLEANTIVKNYYTIKSAGSYVQSPATKLTVRDIFTNNIGGTWSGSTLRLERSGTSTINVKANNGAAYNNIELGPNVKVSSWKSSYANVTTDPTAYLYSQNDNNTNGALRIYGSYIKTNGTDYWSAGRDFDGTVVPSRAVSVRFENGASATYSNGAGLETIGEASKITTVQAISGNYSLAFSDGSLKSNYLKVRNTDINGIKLMGSTKLLQFDNVDLATGLDTGKILSIDASTVDQNTGSVYSNDSFALDSGHSSGINAWLNGSTANSITFTNHSGGLDGEAYDSDGASGCGAIRFDDSSCQFIDQRYYRWRADDGGEAVPDSEWLGGSISGWPYRQRVHIVNNSTVGNTNVAVKVNLPYQSQMKSDFSDIRFTANDGVTQLPYWIEKFVSAGNATVWVKVPQLIAKSSSDVFVYYGNPGATTLSSSSAFTYLYEASNGLAGFSGDTAGFMTSTGPAPIPPLDSVTSPQYLRASDMSGMTTGIMNNSAGAARGITIRERIYINGTENDDTCLTFGVSGTSNWGFCVSPLQDTKNVRLVKDAKKDGFSPNGTVISSADIKLATAGWYSARVDWETTGNITGTLYDPDGNQLISINTTDAYNPGSGIGFTYWYQHGAWDNVMAYPYMPGDPTALVFTPQQHGGAGWRASENTSFMTAYQNEILRLRFGIRNTGTSLTDQQFRLDYAVKGTYPNCESVPDGNYSPVKPHTTCGSSDVCMATSSRFVDNDATTPLLTTPKGLTFVSGRMVESTSNMTAGYNLPGNTYTEVEYALRFTNSAVQPSYCMRVSNNGSRLVSYTKVAEAAVLQPPRVSNWNFTETPIYLNEGIAKHVVATGTVTDFNGISDVVSATGTIFRSGVSGGANCTADDNNCYPEGKTSCTMTDCSAFSCTLSCAADIQYFAEKTDIGTYAAEDWRAEVTVRDSASLSDVKTANAELMELKALSLDQGSVDYGEIDVGSSTMSGANPKIRLSNTGNTNYSLQLEGSDLTAAESLIPVSKQSFATSTFDIGSCSMSLCKQLASTTPVSFGLTLTKPMSTIPIAGNYGDIYFGITIPYGTKAMIHKGLVNVSAN